MIAVGNNAGMVCAASNQILATVSYAWHVGNDTVWAQHGARCEGCLIRHTMPGGETLVECIVPILSRACPYSRYCTPSQTKSSCQFVQLFSATSNLLDFVQPCSGMIAGTAVKSPPLKVISRSCVQERRTWITHRSIAISKVLSMCLSSNRAYRNKRGRGISFCVVFITWIFLEIEKKLLFEKIEMKERAIEKRSSICEILPSLY